MTTLTPLRRHARRGLALALAAAVALSLAACSTGASGSTDARCASSDVALADLPLASDPKNHQGESTACLDDTGVTPVTPDAAPLLPATVTDNQGTEVTVTDTSRILALDIY